jgi:hypothetical protein
MRTSIKFPQWSSISATVAMLILTAATVSAQSQTNKLRIGVYDSRAVAVAYGNSSAFQESVKTVRAEYEKAKAANDSKQLKEIESRMKLQQRRMHEQGFSTGSVAGIVAKVKDALPGMAKKAGVQAIVSKWELNYQSPEVEVVDVTDDMVALFHVSDKGKEWAKGIQARPPVPLEQITDDMD